MNGDTLSLVKTPPVPDRVLVGERMWSRAEDAAVAPIGWALALEMFGTPDTPDGDSA